MGGLGILSPKLFMLLVKILLGVVVISAGTHGDGSPLRSGRSMKPIYILFA